MLRVAAPLEPLKDARLVRAGHELVAEFVLESSADFLIGDPAPTELCRPSIGDDSVYPVGMEPPVVTMPDLGIGVSLQPMLLLKYVPCALILRVSPRGIGWVWVDAAMKKLCCALRAGGQQRELGNRLVRRRGDNSPHLAEFGRRIPCEVVGELAGMATLLGANDGHGRHRAKIGTMADRMSHRTARASSTMGGTAQRRRS